MRTSHASLSAALLSVAILAAIQAGCATPPPPPAHSARTVGLSLREATALVDAFEAKQVAPTHKPAAPASLEDAVAVLKSDRLDLFPASVKFLEAQGTPEALALKAQTLLAWGEAELTVAEVLADTADRLEEGVRALQVRKLNEADTQKLDAERARVQLYRDTDQALRLLAAEHVAAGVEGAQKVIADKPDDYTGYRIAADAHRLRNEWRQFSEMVAKVEETNPDSNGLIFLRGVAAQMRDGDANEAVKLYRQAVENDPQFVRAQAQLVLVQPNVFEQKKELEKLRAIAPDHQIIRWAGPGIEQAHSDALERQQTIQNALQGRPGFAPAIPQPR
jgi:tetratricopeptide (TPR) repeat protein